MKKNILFLLLLILGLSLVLRVYGLGEQGLLFVDEGTFIYRAKTFQLLAEHPANPIQQGFNYADKKILWLLSVMTVLNLSGDSILAVQMFSVIAGLLSIFLTFLVARKIYQSDVIGLVGAFVLGISSMHVFYSRLAMPEMLNMVWVLVMVLCYLKALEHKQGGVWVFLAGLMMSVSVLTNVFRAALMPIVFLLSEAGIGLREGLKEYKDKYRFVIFILTSVIGLLIAVVCLWSLLKSQGIWLVPYDKIMSAYVQDHAHSVFNWQASLFALSYIFQMEGWHYVLIFIAGLFFIKSEKSTLFSLCVVLIYIVSWFFVDEKSARALSPVLPFLAIFTAVTICNIYYKLGRENHVLIVIVFVILGGAQLFWLKPIYAYRSHMIEAINYTKMTAPNARVLTTNQPVALAHDFNFNRYLQLNQQSLDEVKAFKTAGVRFLITDFYKFTSSSVNQEDGSLALNPFLASIEQRCAPIKEYTHFNSGLQQWMIMEVNKFMSDVLTFNKQITPETGRLRVYDLDRCLNIFQ